MPEISNEAAVETPVRPTQRAEMTKWQWTWKEIKRNKTAYFMLAPFFLLVIIVLNHNIIALGMGHIPNNHTEQYHHQKKHHTADGNVHGIIQFLFIIFSIKPHILLPVLLSALHPQNN